MLNPGFGAFFKNTNSGGSEGFVAKFNNDILTPLPIELKAFNCEPSMQGINIYWSTATEFNNDHFMLERTTDGNNYEVLTIVSGKGSSTPTNNYFFLDKNPSRSANYYRLSQYDKNGGMKYFKLIECEQSPSMRGDITISVYTITGQFLFSQKTNDYKSFLDNSDLAKGVYLVELNFGKVTQSLKYVKAN